MLGLDYLSTVTENGRCCKLTVNNTIPLSKLFHQHSFVALSALNRYILYMTVGLLLLNLSLIISCDTLLTKNERLMCSVAISSA